MHICNLAAGFCAVHNNPSVAKTWTLNRLGKSIWSYYWHFLSNLNNTRKTLVKLGVRAQHRTDGLHLAGRNLSSNSTFSAKRESRDFIISTIREYKFHIPKLFRCLFHNVWLMWVNPSPAGTASIIAHRHIGPCAHDFKILFQWPDQVYG